MGTVHNLSSSSVDLGRFFDFLYGEQTGYVYSPTKDIETYHFKQHFFKWPEQRKELINHVSNKTPSHEVYFGPAILNTPAATKEAFKGSYFVWCEFDGNAPDLVDGNLPEPSLKIQSSESKNQHWYWKLDDFYTDPELVENVTQRLAYHLKADLGCWNINRVLRPPNTIHHESKRKVNILKWESTPRSIADFKALPQLPKRLIREQEVGVVPHPLEPIAKYKWSEEDFQLFFTRKIEKGKRSSALTKLGHICIEMGMTNAEALAIIANADGRWGKYANRKDKEDRYLSILNYCRVHQSEKASEEKASVPEDEALLKIYNYEEFMKTEIKFNWVMPGFFHEGAFICIAGPPGIGKSQVVLRLCEKLAKGEKFLQWTPVKPMKTLFVSMEMTHPEVHKFLETMNMESTEKLNENFLITAPGHSLRLTSKYAQAEVQIAIEKFEPEIIWFDSLGKGLADDINSEKIIFEAFEWVDRVLRAKYGLTVGFIHHPRKAQIGNKKPNKLDDLYGSQFIGAGLTNNVMMWKEGDLIEISNPKNRMSEEFKAFKVRRTPTLDFEIVTNNNLLPTSKDSPIFENVMPSSGSDIADMI